MPLAIGNRWVYAVERRNGTVLDTLYSRISGRIEVADPRFQELFVEEMSTASDPVPFKRQLWATTSQGPLLGGLIAANGDTVITDFIQYPFPAEAGNEFYSYSVRWVDGHWQRADSTKWEVFSTSHNMESVIGLFSTIAFRYERRVQSDVSPVAIFELWSPGLGLVGVDSGGLEGVTGVGPVLTYRLINYCLVPLS